MSDNRDSNARAGFTLIEVVVALALTALVLLGARSLFEQLGGYSEDIVKVSGSLEREANGAQLLRELVGRAEIGGDPERRFEGNERGVRIHSWCEVAAGWLERCAATVGFIALHSDTVFAVMAGGYPPVIVRRATGRLLYLRDARNGGSWVKGWSSAVAPPPAIGVVIDGDTTIIPVGDRG